MGGGLIVGPILYLGFGFGFGFFLVLVSVLRVVGGWMLYVMLRM